MPYPNFMDLITPGAGGPSAMPLDPEAEQRQKYLDILGGSAERVEPTEAPGMSTIAKILFTLGAGLSSGRGKRAPLAAFEALKQRRTESARRDTSRRQGEADRAYAGKQRMAGYELGEMTRKEVAADTKAYRETQAEMAQQKIDIEQQRADDDKAYRDKLYALKQNEGKIDPVAAIGADMITAYAGNAEFDMKNPEVITEARKDYELQLEKHGADDFEKSYWLAKFDARFPMPVEEPEPPPIAPPGLQQPIMSPGTPESLIWDAIKGAAVRQAGSPRGR